MRDMCLHNLSLCLQGRPPDPSNAYPLGSGSDGGLFTCVLSAMAENIVATYNKVNMLRI